MMSFGFLGAEASIDPKVLDAARKAQQGFAAGGAGAAALVCAATGVGAAMAPLCAAVGGWIGQNFAKLIGNMRASNAGDSRYKEKLAANAAMREYMTELKRVRDEAAQRTISGLIQLGRERGWPPASREEVARALNTLGANLVSVSIDPVFNDVRDSSGNPVTVISTMPPGSSVFMSGPMSCKHIPTNLCPSGGCQNFRVYDINPAFVKCMEDETKKWAGQLEIAATFYAANASKIQINPAAMRVTMPSKSTGLSTPAKVVGGAAALGGGWWLLTKLGWF